MGKFSMLAALGLLALLAVARAMPQPDTGSSSEESVETRGLIGEPTWVREFIEKIRAKCRENTGSEDAYVALTEAMKSSLMCANASVDWENFLSDVHTLSNDTRTTFFPKYCPQLKKAGSCLDDLLLKATRPCLNEHGFTNVLAVTGMYPDVVDLICKNDGEIIFKLVEPKYEKCADELRDNVRECTISFSAQGGDWDISNLTTTQLGTFSGLRQCVEDKLNDCEAPDIMNVYDLFHNTLFHLASCNNVHPFLEQAFVPFVQFMSAVTEIDNNTVIEN